MPPLAQDAALVNIGMYSNNLNDRMVATFARTSGKGGEAVRASLRAFQQTPQGKESLQAIASQFDALKQTVTKANEMFTSTLSAETFRPEQDLTIMRLSAAKRKIAEEARELLKLQADMEEAFAVELLGANDPAQQRAKDTALEELKEDNEKVLRERMVNALIIHAAPTDALQPVMRASEVSATSGPTKHNEYQFRGGKPGEGVRFDDDGKMAMMFRVDPTDFGSSLTKGLKHALLGTFFKDGIAWLSGMDAEKDWAALRAGTIQERFTPKATHALDLYLPRIQGNKDKMDKAKKEGLDVTIEATQKIGKDATPIEKTDLQAMYFGFAKAALKHGLGMKDYQALLSDKDTLEYEKLLKENNVSATSKPKPKPKPEPQSKPESQSAAGPGNQEQQQLTPGRRPA